MKRHNGRTADDIIKRAYVKEGLIGYSIIFDQPTMSEIQRRGGGIVLIDADNMAVEVEDLSTEGYRILRGLEAELDALNTEGAE